MEADAGGARGVERSRTGPAVLAVRYSVADGRLTGAGPFRTGASQHRDPGTYAGFHSSHRLCRGMVHGWGVTHTSLSFPFPGHRCQMAVSPITHAESGHR